MGINQNLQLCRLVVIKVDNVQVYKKTIKYEDFLNDKIPERRFRLVYFNKEVFYLTQEERDFLLNQVLRGSKYVQIGEHTFTGNFIALYPIRENQYKKQYREVKDEEGKTIRYEEII